MTEFICNSLTDTQSAAKYFARLAKPGQCFALFGDLGYGKTTFAKYLIQSLNESVEDVTSPTFTIVQVYNSDVAEIWHIDCYRLKSEEEFYELGFDENFQDRVTIVEWPEIIQSILPTDTINIKFSLDGTIRKLTVE
ncbi:MAG: tRNA (adenosine(37)-N6)-threonylcarbamoyltransferase complex ATPase subunit type 1 TsaE [Holosporaceae bacterium]|jgi:tRNA threonylcarbamoyladenosine biosynthesis protein TsaE|nr:tRNA (adenosine(37)-N6)-threonylcarbamoyltransferase complex ATPase subunit type 1 TsaE [Holosporaceae bacterium]